MRLKPSEIFWWSSAVLMAIGFGLFFWSRVDAVSLPILGDDSAQYVLLSRSLLQGDGYRSIWMDGAPWHAKFPFGLPLLFAGASFLGSGWRPLFLVPVVFSAGAIFMVFCLLRERIAPFLAWGIAVLTGMSALMYLYSRSLLSETPFLFFLMAALFFADRFLRQDEPAVSDVLGVAGAMLGMFFLRTAGGCLIMAFLLMLFMRAKGRLTKLRQVDMAVMGIIVVPVIVWALFGALDVSGESYWFLLSKQVDPVKGGFEAGSLGGAVLSFLKGVYAIIFYAIPSAMTGGMVFGRTWLSALISALVFGGCCLCARRRLSILELFCASYFLGLSFWPWVQSSGVRMALPVLPLLFYYLFVAIGSVPFSRPAEKFKPLFIAVLFVLLLSVSVGQKMALGKGDVKKDPGPSMEKAFDWIRRATPEQAVFLSPVPAVVYHYAQRRSVAGPPVYGLSDAQVAGLVRDKAVDYVFDPSQVVWQRSALSALGKRLDLVYEVDGQRVYKVTQGE